MKSDAVFHYVLSIVEGAISGACFYRAGKEKGKRGRVLLFLASAVWFANSVLDGVLGARALKAAETKETNGGNDDE